MPRLILMTSRQSGKLVNITGRLTSIGRSDNNAVVIDCDRASRSHAVIDWDGDRFVVTDLDSSNGTFVNGKRVSMQALAHGDTLEMGACKMRFFYDRAASRRLSLVSLPELEPEANPFMALQVKSPVVAEFQRA